MTERQPGGRDEVEVAHEALIRHWPRMQSWLDQDRVALLLRETIREAAQDWEHHDRDESYLAHRGRRLDDALALRQHLRLRLNPLEDSYLEASLALRQQERAIAERARRSRERLLISFTVVALLLAALAGWQWWDARQRRDDAVAAAEEAGRQSRAARAAFSGQLGIQSQIIGQTNPERSLVLAVEALNVTAREGEAPLPGAQIALRDALARAGGRVLHGGAGAVVGTAVSPDGRWVATIADPSLGLALNDPARTVPTASLWDLSSDAPPIHLMDGPVSAEAMAMSPDSHWLVIGPQRWDLTASDPGATAANLPGVGEPIEAVAFSPDSRWLVAGSRSTNDVLLWDLSDPDRPSTPQRLDGHTEPALGFAFSPDNRWLVTANGIPDGNREFGMGDKSVFLWDLTAPSPSATGLELLGHTGSVTSVVFSADSHWLATAVSGYDSHTFEFEDTARLWDLTSTGPRESPIELTGHEQPVTSVAFSADSQKLATGSWNSWTNQPGLTRVWDLTVVRNGPRPEPQVEFRASPVSVAFSPNDDWLVMIEHVGGGRSAPGEGEFMAKLWPIDIVDSEGFAFLETDGQPFLTLLGRTTPFTSFAFSGDRRWLVAGGEERVARVWDLAAFDPRTSMRQLRGHEGAITTTAVDPNDGSIITGSVDGSARFWSLATTESWASPIVVQSEIDERFVVSEDSRWLATIGASGTDDRADNAAVVWDLTATQPFVDPMRLRGSNDALFAVAISRDAHWLATGSYDNRVTLWDLTAADPASHSIPLIGHEGAVNEVTFSPNGRWLATASFDGMARLWDLTASDLSSATHVLVSGAEPVFDLAFSPDGNWLVTVARSDGVLLWDLTSVDPSANAILLGRGDGPSAASFSPDGRWLVTRSGERDVVRLWNFNDGDKAPYSIALMGASEPFVFNGDGSWLFARGTVTSVVGWDLTNGPEARPSLVLGGGQEGIADLDVSLDSHWLATASYDGTAQLWNLSATNPAVTGRVLAVYPISASHVAFSPDSRWLVTAGSAQIGSRSGAETLAFDLAVDNPAADPIVLPAAGESVSRLGFSPDGRWLFSSDHESRTVRIMEMDLDRLKALACRTAGRNLTPEEWRQFVGADVPYQSTCPNLPPGDGEPTAMATPV